MCKKLIFVGFMASGKSTIARKLSEALNIPFFDTDLEIEKLYGPIEKLWRNGEKFFRQLEQLITVNTLLKPENGIIALGGGGYLNSTIRAIIKSVGGVTVFLDRDFNCITKCCVNTGRPLCLLSDLKQLYLSRYSHYTLADKVIRYGDEFNIQEFTVSIRNFFYSSC